MLLLISINIIPLVIFAFFIWAIYSAIQRQVKLAKWPSEVAKVEDLQMMPVATQGSSSQYRVALKYSYVVNGQQYFGEFKRTFLREAEATAFMETVKTTGIRAHYSPTNPADSGLMEADVMTLARDSRASLSSSGGNGTATATAPAAATLPLTSTQRMLLMFFMVVSFAAAAVAAAVNLSAVVGYLWLPKPWMIGLHIGIFAVMIPSIMLAGNNTQGSKTMTKADWQWMVMLVLFAYTFLTAILTAVFGRSEAGTMRVFSAAWLLFYWVSFAICFGRLKEHGSMRCMNGHLMASRQTVCSVCGAMRAES